MREGVQGKGRRGQDRGTRVLIAISLGAAIGAALVASSLASALGMPVALQVVGIGVMWLGLAMRVWSIATLGGAFRTTVEVDPGQAVVSGGPYTWIRHPSYAGLLLILGGFGLALGNWLSLIACLALPLPALVRRIRVEEAALNRVLGDAPHLSGQDRAPDPRTLVSHWRRVALDHGRQPDVAGRMPVPNCPVRSSAGDRVLIEPADRADRGAATAPVDAVGRQTHRGGSRDGT